MRRTLLPDRKFVRNISVRWTCLVQSVKGLAFTLAGRLGRHHMNLLGRISIPPRGAVMRNAVNIIIR